MKSVSPSVLVVLVVCLVVQLAILSIGFVLSKRTPFLDCPAFSNSCACEQAKLV
jgi:hypothetical protein